MKPENTELNIYQEDIAMLEKLEFGIGGFITGHKNLRIWTEGNKSYKYYKGDFFDPDSEYTKEISVEEFNAFARKLSELRINEWENEYIMYDVLDGTQWNLEYKEVGKHGRIIFGDNAYPDCWEEFIATIGVVIPEILVELYDI